MDIQFFDNGEAPKPKQEIQIEALTATPFPDRFRVFVEIKVTPFIERPNLILVARDQHDKIVSELNIIETMHANMEFTLHIRGLQDPAGAYTLDAILFYEQRTPPQDQKTTSFTVPDADEENQAN